METTSTTIGGSCESVLQAESSLGAERYPRLHHSAAPPPQPIATSALGALGVDAERACAELLADIGRSYDVDLARAIREMERTLGLVWNNVALMMYEQGRDVDEARAFARRWLLNSDEEIAKNMEFVRHPTWRAYGVVYEAAQTLVEAWTGGDPARYRRLLTEQLTTTDLEDRSRPA